MKMKHTPTPWTINTRASSLVEYGRRSICTCGGYSDGTEETHDENLANAEFIVKAVNNHYQLLEALEACVKEIPFTSFQASSETKVLAQKAIKKAQGE